MNLKTPSLAMAACAVTLAAMPAQAADYSVLTIVDGKAVLNFQGSDTPASAKWGDTSAAVQMGFSPLPSLTATSQTSAPANDPSTVSATWVLDQALVNSQPYSWTEYGSDPGTGGTLSCQTNVPVNQSAYGYVGELSGSYQGSILIQLDANGSAHGIMGMMADAQENASAFIDSYLYIDPAYLQAHPEAGLSFEPGVGNLAPVPEPTGVALWLAGLGALA